MDTITTIQSLLTFDGSAQPAMVALTQNERRLIAAAPDLLAALKLHIAYEATPTDRGGKNGPKGKSWSAFVAARDAALAKAEGRAP